MLYISTDSIFCLQEGKDTAEFFQLIELHLFKAIYSGNVHKAEALTKCYSFSGALFGVVFALIKHSWKIIFSYRGLKEKLWILNT